MTTTKKFPTRAEMDQFARSQNERFDIAALLVRMKKDAETVIEQNPRIVTENTTRRSWRLPGIAERAVMVLDLRDQVRSCIEQGDAAGAAAHAIQADRAYHSMIQYRLRPASLYGINHLFMWRDEYIDATETGRKILGCIGRRNRVPIRGLFAVTGANRGTFDAQLSRLNKKLRPFGYELQVRDQFVNVTYTPL